MKKADDLKVSPNEYFKLIYNMDYASVVLFFFHFILFYFFCILLVHFLYIIFLSYCTF